MTGFWHPLVVYARKHRMTQEVYRRILGLDIGEKTIGIAMSDAMLFTAQPLQTLQRTNIKNDLRILRELCATHDVSEIVVGLPRHMNGQPSAMAEMIEKLCDKLKSQIQIPIAYWDERWSTQAAEKSLIESNMRRNKRKSVIDQVAACLILQGFLDAKRYNQSPQT